MNIINWFALILLIIMLPIIYNINNAIKLDTFNKGRLSFYFFVLLIIINLFV